MCADLGATLGPLGGAWLYQVYGPAMPFYANGIILGLCAVVLLIFLKIPSISPGEENVFSLLVFQSG
jgi:MFS family permease